MTKKIGLKEMLEQGKQVLAPCVWDCFSAKAVAQCGFEAMLLSGAAVSSSMIGMPDLGILTGDELIWATERIASYSDLPVIVDFDEGYGDSPLNTFRNVERLVRAGAKGFTLDDGQGIRGWARLNYSKRVGNAYEVFPTEVYLAKIKAALAAIEGTDCVLIARTECRPNYGLDEAIDRCARAADLGAQMTLINRLYNIDECKKVADKISGWKMYPDICTVEGKPEVELNEIMDLGFNFVTMHYLEKGSMWGMMKYGKENFKNQTATYSDLHQMDGLTPAEQMAARSMTPEKWLDLEREFYMGLKK